MEYPTVAITPKSILIRSGQGPIYGSKRNIVLSMTLNYIWWLGLYDKYILLYNKIERKCFIDEYDMVNILNVHNILKFETLVCLEISRQKY